MATSIIWRGDLRKGLAAFNGVMNSRLTAIAHYTAREMEAHARAAARWKDRTGNARNGLKADVDIVPFHHYSITLSHSVPYGIWLEVRWSGRYAIIMPTIRQQSPRLAAMIEGVFRGVA